MVLNMRHSTQASPLGTPRIRRLTSRIGGTNAGYQLYNIVGGTRSPFISRRARWTSRPDFLGPRFSLSFLKAFLTKIARAQGILLQLFDHEIWQWIPTRFGSPQYLSPGLGSRDLGCLVSLTGTINNLPNRRVISRSLLGRLRFCY